jgi:hypothetical protein
MDFTLVKIVTGQCRIIQSHAKYYNHSQSVRITFFEISIAIKLPMFINCLLVIYQRYFLRTEIKTTIIRFLEC